ncbi:MAG: transcription antitermination factor NusB [Phycisphaerales bacterium]|nr:transcription antitermination factor NusB [Phycisphaerales bacterium]
MSARRSAYASLSHRVESFPDLHRHDIDRTGLDPRDARLAIAIDHQSTLRWLSLQAIIEPHLKQSWVGLKPVVRAALLGGASQLLLMDRVPDHAVLHETVEWIKSSSQPRAAGLVNAILRRVCDVRKGSIQDADPTRRDVLLRSDGSGIELTKPLLSSNDALQIEQQCSCPSLLMDHWTKLFGIKEARQLALHGIADAPLIIATSEDTQLEHLSDAHEIPGYRVVRSGHSVMDVLEADPDAIIQDPASADPVRATVGLQPACILDLCAGRGTKTKLLSKQHPDSRIIATDYDIKLIDDLHEATESCDNVEVRTFNQLDDLRDQVDLLVMDVPCSNTAVLARRCEARYRFNFKSLAQLVDQQRQIIADALPFLTLSGKILYSTCSLDPAENQEQARWIMKWHKFSIESERVMPPRGIPGESPTIYNDGSYHVLLAR